MELHVAREIAAPIRLVWDTVTDLSGAPQTLSRVERIERLDDGDRFDVGTRWRETRTMFGRETTEEMVVTEIDPPLRYTVVTVNGTTTYTSTVAIEPLDDGRCRLEMSFDATASGLVGRGLAATIGRLFARPTRNALRQDLDDIAAAVQGS